MVQRLAAEVGLAVPCTDDLVGLFPADQRAVIRQVGQFHEQVVQRRLGVGERGLHFADLAAERGGLLLRVGGVRTGRLELADFPGLPVPLGTLGVDLGGELAPQRVRLQDRSQVNVVGALEQGRPHVFRVRPDQLDIKHRP